MLLSITDSPQAQQRVQPCAAQCFGQHVRKLSISWTMHRSERPMIQLLMQPIGLDLQMPSPPVLHELDPEDILSAAVLSDSISFSSITSPRSLNIASTPLVAMAPSRMARSSDSAVDNVTICCLPLLHSKGTPPYRTTHPPCDLADCGAYEASQYIVNGAPVHSISRLASWVR